MAAKFALARSKTLEKSFHQKTVDSLEITLANFAIFCAFGSFNGLVWEIYPTRPLFFGQMQRLRKYFKRIVKPICNPWVKKPTSTKESISFTKSSFPNYGITLSLDRFAGPPPCRTPVAPHELQFHEA